MKDGFGTNFFQQLLNWQVSLLAKMRSDEWLTTRALFTALQILESSPTPLGLEHSGSTSTPERESLTPTPPKRRRRYSVLCASSTSLNLFSLARVTVSICIGHYEKLFRWQSGVVTPRASNYFVIVQTWRLMGLELRIYLQYCVLPEPTTESTESTG